MDELYPEPRNTKAILTMKSKRAEEAIERYRKKFTAGFVTKNEVETVKEYCRLFTEVVELAEQDAEEKIEALKARAVEACCFACTQSGAGCDHRLRTDDYYLCDILNNFIQKLNEQ